MIFEQLFDQKSSTYTYIIASGEGREALIIDPVIEHSNEYSTILKNLDLKLVKVIDTHIHADHISALNELNKRTNCIRVMGEKSKSEVVDLRIKDGEKIKIENEKNNNPRLQVSSKEEYADIMNNLNLANPKMMDVAVPANVKGFTLDNIN